ncbi:MAG TPA: hypothetical protein VEU52_04685, partial [Candidatus Limnocylindrales bacterium]|nr:hypothetical protein [Candidatus Limnocylindrales bacterium]
SEKGWEGRLENSQELSSAALVFAEEQARLGILALAQASNLAVHRARFPQFFCQEPLDILWRAGR